MEDREGEKVICEEEVGMASNIGVLVCLCATGLSLIFLSATDLFDF